MDNLLLLVGGWGFNPSEKCEVHWDYCSIPNWMESHKSHVPNHQPVTVMLIFHYVDDEYWWMMMTHSIRYERDWKRMLCYVDDSFKGLKGKGQTFFVWSHSCCACQTLSDGFVCSLHFTKWCVKRTQVDLRSSSWAHPSRTCDSPCWFRGFPAPHIFF